MASNLHRKSGSSDRSTSRKKVHLGTGTSSRIESAHPKAQVKNELLAKNPSSGGRSSRARNVNKVSSNTSGHLVERRSPKQAERLRRRSDARRRVLVRAGAVLLAVVLIAVAWFALTRSQVFEIRNVEVEGNEHLSTEEVLSAAGVADGTTLLRLDAGRTAEHLQELSWVEDVRVSRSFPSTLRIVIEERVPAVLVDTGVTFWYVDRRARVIAESVPTTGGVLPVVRDLPDFVAEPGYISDSTTLSNAIAVLSGISSEISSNVRVVTAPSVNETTLLTVSGVEVLVGEAVQLEEKSLLIQDILAERAGQVVFIDVRSVERPISRGIGQ